MYVANRNVVSESLFTLIDAKYRTLFSTAKVLQAWIADQEERFRESEEGQYLAITGVNSKALEEIDYYRDTGKLSQQLRFSFEPDAELLIIKMSGGKHEIPHNTLVQHITRALDTIGISEDDYAWVGTTRFQGRGPGSSRSKESDQAFMPQGRRCTTHFPSFVVEVGVSESLALLRKDAAFWLTRSAGECRLVIIVSVGRFSAYMAYELWVIGPVAGGPTRANPNPPPQIGPVPRQLQTVIQADGAFLGPPTLSLPLSVLFDHNTPNINLQQSLLITNANLHAAYRRVINYS